MRKVRLYHLIFGASLISLAALGTWWTIFFMRSVEFERKARLSQLMHASVVTALMLGHADERPETGPRDGPVPLLVEPASSFEKGDIFALAVPRYPDLGVRPDPAAIAAVEDKIARRRLMLIGEGIFMLLLLAVLSFMLYRLVIQERRHLRRMEAFVASVSHEMKTPLAGVKSLLQTLADGKVPEAEEARLLAMGLKESQRLEHMIENVLISGRLRGGRFKVERERLELKPFTESFVERRRRHLTSDRGSLELEWRAQRKEIRVLADPHALRVILDNLVDNAFKYGGAAPAVRLCVEAGNGGVEIAVEDDGIGFDPAKAEHLFAPFRRDLGPQVATQPGTGLGLSISLALARKMGGGLRAKSDGPERGSRFTLSLEEAG